jgi:hypothetical protein
MAVDDQAATEAVQEGTDEVRKKARANGSK